MAYPKPLSEKTISRMYADAKINDNKRKFLHTLFQASANLYGSIEIGELWAVYQTLVEEMPITRVTKKEMIAFSGIVRREDVPYYIFEIDEVYCEEKRKDTERFLVTKAMVDDGYGKFRPLWNLHEIQLDKEPYVPENLLDYARDEMTEGQRKLLAFLGNLKVSATEYTDRVGRVYPCEHLGEFLKDFEYLDPYEQSEVRYLSGEFENGPKKNEKKLAAFLEKCKGAIADRIYKDYIWRIKSGWVDPKTAMEMLLEDIRETGVLMSEEEWKEFINSINCVQNTTNLWCNMGWTPMDLTEKMFSEGNYPSTISLGPGIAKAISEGKIDRKELFKMLEEKGFKVIE